MLGGTRLGTIFGNNSVPIFLIGKDKGNRKSVRLKSIGILFLGFDGLGEICFSLDVNRARYLGQRASD